MSTMPPPPPKNGRWNSRQSLQLAALLLVCSANAPAGNITCNVPSQTLAGEVTFNVSDYNAALPGEILSGGWHAITSLPTRYSCTFSGHGSGNFNAPIHNIAQVPQPRSNPALTVSYDNQSHYVYQVPGVLHLGYIFSIGTGGVAPVNNSSTSEWKTARVLPVTTNADPITFTNSFWYIVNVQLVKLQDGLTGPFPNIPVFTLGREKWKSYVYASNPNNIISSAEFPATTFTLKINIIDDVPASCTSPSVPTVYLPMVFPANFNGAGTTTGETPFEIKFQDCRYNLTSISYKFAPSNSTPSPDPALGLLGNSGTATGVAVQIVHDNPQRTVHPLNVDAILNNPATGLPVKGDFNFKLLARYYQTGNTAPTAGTVKAAMIFHLVYH